MADLTLTGTAAGQANPDADALSPFAGVGLTSSAAAPYVTSTVGLSSTANGALSHLGIGTLSADGSTYMVRGSPADVQAALRGLVFTPTLHQVPVGQSVTTGFTLTASDAAGTVTDARTTVVATAADKSPTVTYTSATQVPTAANSGDPNGPGTTSFTPFAYTTISDPDAGATEATSLTLTQNGAATDVVGVLSGAGLTKTGVGTYTLTAASPAAETAALQALRFTPSSPDTGATLGVAFSVSDGVGAPTAAASTIALSANPGGETVISNSLTSTTTFSDTPASNATHTYATTVDGVLSSGTVVYDQSFNLPYSDPQVQAAVAQAQAAILAAGQTPGATAQTASNLATVSSQTTTTQTGSTTGPGVVTSSDAVGPTYVGPNTSVGGDTDRGFLHVQPGETDINVNTATTTTVDRTVTTTSTDLLSQQYVVTGSSTAMPTSTTLVSSSAQGVEGNAYSSTILVTDGVTGDGGSVLFISQATNLIPGNSNPGDIYLKNTSTGAITLVDVSSVGASSNASINSGALNENGNLVAFSTQATNLDPRATDGAEHLYIRNISAGTLTLVSPSDYTFKDASTGVTEASAQFQNLDTPSVSGNGRYIAVETNNTGGGTGVLLLDTLAHTGVVLSKAGSSSNAVSEDGSTVVFNTPSNNHNEVYAYSIATDSLQLLSDTQGANAPPVPANGNSGGVSVSNDGSRVVFGSSANNLDSRATGNGIDHVYVKDVTTGQLFLVDTAADGAVGNQNARDGGVSGIDASISGDGTMVAFASSSTNLVPGVVDGELHIYIKNLTTGAISLLDQAGAVPGDSASGYPLFSSDSAHVAFSSSASNLVANDTNGEEDVFLTTLAAAVTPPAITGVTSPETDPGGATLKPFAAATVTDTNAAATVTVQLQSVAVVNGQPQNLGTGGAFAGGGFTVAGNTATFTSTSLAAVQAAVQAVNFTPSAADARIIYTISDSTGGTSIASVDVLTPANNPPTITGVPASETDPGQASFKPFATAVANDPDAGQTFKVTVVANKVVPAGQAPDANGGTFSGGGFTIDASGGYDFSSTSIVAIQAALRAVSFTPSAAAVEVRYGISDGTASTSGVIEVASTPATPTNTPPAIAGAQAGQADNAGVAISPFSQVTVTDPDAGQSETVTVSFAAANGTLAGGGLTLTGTSGGVSTYSVTAPAGAAGASASAAQADLRAATFTPTAGQSATTTFTITVNDGQAPATDSTTSVVAAYTAPAAGGGRGGTVTSTPSSVQYGLLTEFQNLERALASGSDAFNPVSPVYAAFQAEKAVAAQLDGGQITLAQAEASLAHLVDGTTAVAVAAYGFFTGSTPTAAGLDYLVHSPANATDLNDAYYARFSTENRYINFAANLATGPGAGAAAFQANYGSLSLAEATAKAYAAVFGATADAAKVSALLDTLVPDGLGGQETRAQYFAQYGGDGPNGQGTKAAMIGFLLSNAVHDGSGVYGASTEHYLATLAHGFAPAFGSELALTYGAPVSLVGVPPTPDPTITG